MVSDIYSARAKDMVSLYQRGSFALTADGQPILVLPKATIEKDDNRTSPLYNEYELLSFADIEKIAKDFKKDKGALRNIFSASPEGQALQGTKGYIVYSIFRELIRLGQSDRQRLDYSDSLAKKVSTLVIEAILDPNDDEGFRKPHLRGIPTVSVDTAKKIGAIDAPVPKAA